MGGENKGIFVVGFPDAETDRLHADAVSAVERLALGKEVKRAEMKDAAKYGVSLFPALVVDGKVVSEGEIRSVEDLAQMIKSA